MAWYPGLVIKAKSKSTGRMFTVRDSHTSTIAGKKQKCYTLEEDGTGATFIMPESQVELIKKNDRDNS